MRSARSATREALLLHLRRLLVGDRLACVLSCPDPACGEPMDVELAVEELLVGPYAEAAFAVQVNPCLGYPREQMVQPFVDGHRDRPAAAPRTLAITVTGAMADVSPSG